MIRWMQRVYDPLAWGAIVSMAVLPGCFAMVAGVHQDVHFKSDVPNVSVGMDEQACRIPCTLTIRRQWGTFQMQATQNGEIVAEGPISRVEEYAKRDCDSTHDNFGLMMIAAFTDGLLIIPGIIDISTGIVVWHPDTVVIEPGTYRLEDRCFDQPVVLSSQPAP
jgi:hypothetical protein